MKGSLGIKQAAFLLKFSEYGNKVDKEYRKSKIYIISR